MTENTIKSIDTVLEVAKKYIKKEESIDLIKRAYEYAEKMHAGQMRKSGDPYITHPLSVAYILATLHASPTVISAGLLHDVIEDTEATYDDVTLIFNMEIADLVTGVTNLKNLKYESREQKTVENFQKLFLAMAKDIRVIIIKIADRLHNIRTLDVRSENARRRIAKETIDIIVPIVHRLGMYKIKAEMEDKCFYYLDRDSYEEVTTLIEKERKKSSMGLEEFISKLKSLLAKEDFVPDIKGRVKTTYSVHKKMSTKGKEFNEIFDLFAVRIIVDTVGSCYEALGTIQTFFKPIPKRFKDYIAMPKPNLYQSLHTTVIAASGLIFEVQIRTRKMDEIAEEGVAAHWAYKEGSQLTAHAQQQEILASLPWFKKFVEYSGDEERNPEEEADFFNVVIEDLLPANVFVLTPNGRVIDLPSGSTTIDFAYKVHTDVGHSMVGACVNGKIVPISYELKTGEVCEIRTSKQSFGPSEDWVKLVKTRHARNKIKQFFKQQNREEKEVLGKEKLEKELISRGVSLADVAFGEKEIELFYKYDVRTILDLYYAIEVGHIGVKTVADKLLLSDRKSDKSNDAIIEQYQQKSEETTSQNKSETGVIVPGVSLPYIKLAKCCMPIPGDDIVGIVTKCSGIVVHNADCHNIEGQENLREIEVLWDKNVVEKGNASYEIDLLITAYDRVGLLADIVNVFNKMKINVINVNVNVAKDQRVKIEVRIKMKNNSMLEQYVANVKKVKDIYSVERLYR